MSDMQRDSVLNLGQLREESCQLFRVKGVGLGRRTEADVTPSHVERPPTTRGLLRSVAPPLLCLLVGTEHALGPPQRQVSQPR